MKRSPQRLTESVGSFPTAKPYLSPYIQQTQCTKSSKIRMRPLFAVEIPSYQPHKPISPTSSSSYHMIEAKHHPHKSLSQTEATIKPTYQPHKSLFRAEAAIKQLRNFGPDMKALEIRTQGLFVDQASLNQNLLNCLQPLHSSPQASSSSLPSSSSSSSSPASPFKSPQTLLEKHPSVPGPLQHPYAHLEQLGLTNWGLRNDNEGVEMEDVSDTNINGSSTVPEKAEHWNGDENQVPIMSSGPNSVLHSSRTSRSSTPDITIESPRHLHPQNITSSTSEQIELELSLLMIEKNNELRLIHTELAKAQVMLEQLRRVHLKPFFLTTNARGELYMMRLLLRQFSAEEKKQKLEEEERRTEGRGIMLRNKYVRR